MHRSFLVLFLALLSSAAAAQSYDLVLRGGRVLDGRGNPWIAADVAVDDGRVVRIGHVPESGAREIDVTGKYVSPGWIDMMDQSGRVLPINGLAENKVRMGVTTALGGEGGTPVPAERISSYFDELERRGISINFGSYYSATQARVAVMGPGDGEPSDEQLEAMKQLVDRAMREGALGLTTALIYPPSSFQTTDELVELARVAARHGGIYASHIRDEGSGLVGAVEEAIEIGERGGLPVEVFHFKAAYEPGWGKLITEAAAVIDAARERGVDVAADVYPYTAGGTGLEATVPSWVFGDGAQTALQRLRDPEVRERLKRELETGSPGWWNIIEAAGGWDGVVLVNARNEDNARFEGRTLQSLADEAGRHPADVAWDLVLEGQGRVMAIYHMMNEEDVREALRQPWSSIGSDAGAVVDATKPDATGLPHPRSFGTFPRILARYVRELGDFSLEEAIRKMTSWPATRMRLKDRGALEVGAWADIVVFDLETIEDRATWDEPMLLPSGIEWVLVNGVVVVEQGDHTGAKPGRVIRGQGATSG
ncbi:MAG: amidohydrolase family protein [Acidobacteriota bacterium]